MKHNEPTPEFTDLKEAFAPWGAAWFMKSIARMEAEYYDTLQNIQFGYGNAHRKQDEDSVVELRENTRPNYTEIARRAIFISQFANLISAVDRYIRNMQRFD